MFKLHADVYFIELKKVNIVLRRPCANCFVW